MTAYRRGPLLALMSFKETVDNRIGFLQWVLGDLEGFIAIGALHSRTGDWEETIFAYPNELLEVGEYIASHNVTHNLYFCPTLLTEPKRVKKNIARSCVIWADLDTCDPDLLRIKPSATIETSPGRWQGYWKLDRFEHATDVERINKRIAYYYADNGCDKSGWDLTQYLRIPGTLNHKYVPDLHNVKVGEFVKERVYALTEFDVFPELHEEEVTDLAIPFPEVLPDYSGEDFLTSIKTSVHPKTWTLFEVVPDEDWSKNLWSLELTLFDIHCDPVDVFIVARDAACNKYARDRHSAMLLWKDVLRAKEHSENQSIALAADSTDFDWYVADKQLLTKAEQEITKHYRTIIDDYFDWASSIGDAAPAYHVAGAFVVLSTLISGPIRLPTSYGTVIPNLWFMILADTTLTRKTTAMDLAMDIVVEIDAAALAATDGSVEGILNTMATRPRMPSVFLRDEFSGLLEGMKKKDYLSGMLEMFTKLYDGKYQKKILSKTTIEIRDPVLIMFVGGIRQRIFELLSFEHINSGFMPRFCIITANSDVNRIKPLGPPTFETHEGREVLVQRFRDLHAFYNPGLAPGQLMPHIWNVTLTPDAWVRYNKFESDMTDIGVGSAMPDLMTPMMVRLCTSGLKAAVLLAATRCEGEIVVTEHDLLKAFFYVDTWKTHAIAVVANAGKSPEEKIMERVFHMIDDAGNEGVMRSKIMQTYRLNAREAQSIFDTLEQRGMIKREKGRGLKYYTTRKTIVNERLVP